MHRVLPALFLLALAGCGGGASAFLGTWSSSGTTTWSGCPVPPSASSASDTVTIIAGPNGGITTESSNSHCNLNWTVSGTTATLVAGQSCSGTTNGTSWTATWTSGTGTLSGGTTTWSASGTQTFSNANGSETCAFSQSGTATKQGA